MREKRDAALSRAKEPLMQRGTLSRLSFIAVLAVVLLVPSMVDAHTCEIDPGAAGRCDAGAVTVCVTNTHAGGSFYQFIIALGSCGGSQTHFVAGFTTECRDIPWDSPCSNSGTVHATGCGDVDNQCPDCSNPVPCQL